MRAVVIAAATASTAAVCLIIAWRRRRYTLRLRTAPPTVANLLFGASTLAGFTYAPCDRDMALDAVRAAIDVGIRCFDTAPHYGLGLSEQRLGEALAMHAGMQHCQVWTKVGRYVLPRAQCEAEVLAGRVHANAVEVENMHGHPDCIFPDTDPNLAEVADYTAAGAARSHHDSLMRLRLGGNCVLSGQRVHDPDTDARCLAALSRGGAVEELVRRRRRGEIGEVSIGCWSVDHTRQMLQACPPGTFGSIMVAGRWNLLDQSGYDLLLECQRSGVKVHNASVFASGLLAGGATYQNKEAPAEMLSRTMRWTALAERFGTSLPAVALHFALLPQVVELAAVGMRSREEVEQNARWLEEPVDPRIWAEAQRVGLLPQHLPVPTG